MGILINCSTEEKPIVGSDRSHALHRDLRPEDIVQRKESACREVLLQLPSGHRSPFGAPGALVGTSTTKLPGSKKPGRQKTLDISLSRDLRTGLAKKVGVAIKILRLSKGLTQRQLAMLLSETTGKPVDQAYVSKIEASGRGVSLDRLGLILDVLNHGVEEFAKVLQSVEDTQKMDDKAQNQALRDLTKKHLGE